MSVSEADAVIAKLSPRLRIQELEHERDRLRLLLDRAALRVAVLELAFDVNE